MARACPTCGSPVVWEGNPDRPFCSERCRLIDLGNWASQEYTVPGNAVDPDDREDYPRSHTKEHEESE